MSSMCWLTILILSRDGEECVRTRNFGVFVFILLVFCSRHICINRQGCRAFYASLRTSDWAGACHLRNRDRQADWMVLVYGKRHKPVSHWISLWMILWFVRHVVYIVYCMFEEVYHRCSIGNQASSYRYKWALSLEPLDEATVLCPKCQT